MTLNITRSLWTPTIGATSPGDLSVSYTIQRGVWAQSDNLVLMGCDVQFTPTYTTTTGALLIQGWPEGPLATDITLWSGSVRSLGTVTWPTSVTQIVPVFLISNQGNSVVLSGLGTGLIGSVLPLSVFPSGAQYRFQVQMQIVIGP